LILRDLKYVKTGKTAKCSREIDMLQRKKRLFLPQKEVGEVAEVRGAG